MEKLYGYGEIIYKQGENSEFRLISDEVFHLGIRTDRDIRMLSDYFYLNKLLKDYRFFIAIKEDDDINRMYHILSNYDYRTNIKYVIYHEIIPITDDLKNKVIQQFISYFSSYMNNNNTHQPELIYFFDQIWKLLKI